MTSLKGCVMKRWCGTSLAGRVDAWQPIVTVRQAMSDTSHERDTGWGLMMAESERLAAPKPIVPRVPLTL